VLAAGKRHTPQSDGALEELCQRIGFRFTPTSGGAATAKGREDSVQSFFARFLGKNYLAGLSAERGRFARSCWHR